jgi:N-acetylmuramoyl-L-alanine amidase
MRLPVLRETRMPAVLCVVGPVQAAVNDAPRLIAGLLHALDLWISRAT